MQEHCVWPYNSNQQVTVVFSDQNKLMHDCTLCGQCFFVTDSNVETQAQVAFGSTGNRAVALGSAFSGEEFCANGGR